MANMAKGEKGDKGERGLSIKGDRGEPGRAGNSITDVRFDQRGHLIIETDDKTYDLGLLRSGGGTTTIIEQSDNNGNISLTEDYILVGNEQGIAEESAALIDINSEINDINQTLNAISSTTPILQESSIVFPDAQVLTEMQSGFLFHLNGKLISFNPLEREHLPDLSEGTVWVGDANNKATETPYELNAIPVSDNLDLSGFRITNLGDPVNGADVTNKNYVDNAVASSGTGQITLTGAVSGTGTGTIVTTLTDITTSQISDFDSVVKSYQLDEFQPPTSTLDLGNQRLVNVDTPIVSTDAANKEYVDNTTSNAVGSLTVDGFVTGGPAVGNVITTNRGPDCLLTNIPAGGNVSMDNNSITNLVDPVNNQDAATKSYVDSVSGSGPITLTGAVTGSGTGTINTTLTPITTSQISDFNSAVTAYRLDEFAAPNTSLSVGNQRIINVATPVNSQDAVNKAYVDSINNNNENNGVGVFGVQNNSTSINLTANVPTKIVSNFGYFTGGWWDYSSVPGRITLLTGLKSFNCTGLATVVNNSFVSANMNIQLVINGAFGVLYPLFSQRVNANSVQTLSLQPLPFDLSTNDYVELFITSTASITVTVQNTICNLTARIIF